MESALSETGSSRRVLPLIAEEDEAYHGAEA
jgi:hypothetical protein